MDRSKLIENKIINFCNLESSFKGGILFLNGPWGSGKTFFWKQISTKIKPEPIYVSLFGVQNAKDVRIKITTAVIAGDDETTIFGKLRTLTSKLNLPKLLGTFTKINVDVDLLELMPGRKVFCFDDLERVSANSQIDEILGFINHLSEHKGHRCLIILNETEMKEPVKASYNSLKEKLSFSTLEYYLDLRSRITSFVEEKKQIDSTNEINFLISYMSSLNIKNLRLVKAIIDSLGEIKEAFKNEIPEEVLKFLIALLANDSEGKRNPFDFYVFNPIQFHLSQPSTVTASDPQKEFYEKYFGKNTGYRPYKSVFDFIRTGLLDTSLFQEEVFGPLDQRDTTSKRIEEIRNTHFFFSTDSELTALQTEIQAIANTNRAFHFNEVSSLVRALSASIKLLEQPYPIALPNYLENLARESIKTHDDIWQLESSFAYRGDDLIFSFARDMKNICNDENLRRADVKYQAGISNFDRNEFKNAIELNRKCLSKIFSAGDFAKIINGNISEQSKTDFITLIIDGLKYPDQQLKAELSLINNDLLSRYSNSTSKTDRLRIFRLIEQTGLQRPTALPTIVL